MVIKKSNISAISYYYIYIDYRQIGTLYLNQYFSQNYEQSISIGDCCKVEFNQPSCLLYSMPNLLVIQQLINLYLGISRVARSLQVTRSCTRAKHAEKLKHHASQSTIGQKVPTGHSVSSRLVLVAQSSHEAKPPASSILKKLTLHIPNTYKYKYPSFP